MKTKRTTIGFMILIILTGIIGVSEAAVGDISSQIVRLHILANSNSKEDTELKLKVRDRLIYECGNEKINRMGMEEIEKICADEIEKNGKTYSVKAQRGTFYFPTKTYENISLPAGEYEALRIVIGNGAGENWWCVMYPPLCFSESLDGNLNEENAAILKTNMKDDNFDMIYGETIKLKPTFKAVEIWQKLKHKL